MYNILDDIHVSYNIKTKEIMCPVLKISDVATQPIIISQNEFAIMKIED